MRHTRRNEQELARPAEHLVLEVLAPAREDRALQDKDAGFVAQMQMGLGLRAGWDDDQVHGEPRGSHRGRLATSSVGQPASHGAGRPPD